MIRFSIISVLISLAASLTIATAQNLTIEEKRQISKELTSRLASAETPEDSINLLYNIYDVTNRDNARLVAMKLFEVASRAGDNFAQNDILRQVSSISVRQDSIQDLLMEKALTLPENIERKKTVTYIKMNQIRNRARNAEDDVRQRELKAVMTQLSNH